MKNTKQILCVIISLICLFSFSSCSFIEGLSSNMHGELEWVDDSESETSILSYQGNNYYSDDGWVSVNGSNRSDVIELGWQYRLPFPSQYFYAFSKDEPLYICCGDKTQLSYLGVYFREDFSFFDQVYIVSDTNIEVVLSEVITKCNDDILIEGESNINFYLYMKDDPRLEIQILSTYRAANDWYFMKDEEYWLLDKDFAEKLIENEVICEG